VAAAGPRLAVAWQTQYTELSGGAACARGRCWPPPLARDLCVDIMTMAARFGAQSVFFAWPPLARGRLSCGRRSTSWRSGWLSQAQHTQSFLACGRRWPAAQLAFVWQAQYTEPPGGAAARVGAAGLWLTFVWQTGFRGKGAVHRASWRSCCARERFAWQAWHLATWTFVLRGRRGTW